MEDVSALRSELECPVCMQYMVEEIYLCSNGHSICKSCVEKVQHSCPICRGTFENRRNYTLENIAAVMSFPCSHCKEEIKGKNVTNHERDCDTGLFVCNMIYMNCNWQGPYNEVKSHIEKHHKENIKSWKYINNHQTYILFLEDLPFFVFYKEVDNISAYSSVFIGPKKNAKEYILHVDFADQSGLGYKMSGATPCISLCRSGEVFSKEKLSFAATMMSNFTGNDNYYTSTLTIHKKDQNQI